MQPFVFPEFRNLSGGSASLQICLEPSVTPLSSVLFHWHLCGCSLTSPWWKVTKKRAVPNNSRERQGPHSEHRALRLLGEGQRNKIPAAPHNFRRVFLQCQKPLPCRGPMGIAWSDSGLKERSAGAREESQRLSEGPRWRDSGGEGEPGGRRGWSDRWLGRTRGDWRLRMSPERGGSPGGSRERARQVAAPELGALQCP